MALQKIEVPLVVSGGIDTKTDRKLVPDQKMLITENVDYRKIGTLRKSTGTTKLTASTNQTDDLNDVSSRIFSHNDEIITLGKQGSKDIYSYSANEAEWKAKNNGGQTFVPVDIEVDQDSADYLNCSSSSLAEFPLAGFRIFGTIVYKADGTSPFRLTKIDYETGEEQIFEPDTTYDSYEIKVIGKDDATDPIIWVIVVQVGAGASGNADRVLCYTFDKYITQVGSTVTLTSDTTATSLIPSIDAIYVETSGLFYAGAVSTTSIDYGYVTTSGAISVSTTYTPSVSINIFFSPWDGTGVSKRANISCCESGNNIYIVFPEYQIFSDRDVFIVGVSKSNLSVSKTEQKAIDKTVYPSIYYKVDVFEAPIPSSSDILIVAASGYEKYTLSGKDNIYPITNVVNIFWQSSYLVNLITQNPISGSEIASKGYSNYPTDLRVFYYVMTTSTQSAEDSTFNLVKFSYGTDFNISIVTKFFNNNAVDIYTKEYETYYNSTNNYTYMSLLNSLVIGKDDKLYFPCIVKADLIGKGNSFTTAFPYYSVKNASVSLSIGDDLDFVTSRLSQSTHLSSSVVKEYDGTSLRYSGFQRVPYVTYTTSASNPIDDGTYLYQLIFKYFDNNGEIHFSGTSSIDSVTTTSQSVVITKSPANEFDLNVEKDAIAEIAIYRTAVNQSGPFYYVGSMDSSDTSFSDIYTDSVITSNEQIYTSGGVLSNNIVPPFSYISSGLDRMFGVSLEDRNKIYYSQKRIVENAIEWSEALFFRVDGHGKNIGQAVGVENLDDKMVILKNDSCLYISGDGPLRTGEQNTFTSPSVVSQEIGCSEKQSIVATPRGIMFKGKKGIYLIDRSLQVSYIGAPVEEYNNETINGSAVSKTRNEVYFQTDNRMMIYNYLQNNWSTNTYLGGKSACIWKDNLAVLKSDGFVYYQNDSIYTDDSAAISMKIATPWYKMKGITGFGRLYEVVVLGEYKSDHTLNIRVYYDYDDTDYDDYTFDVTSINIYEFAVKPSKQKCQAFKIEIWDTPTGGSGESLELTGISVRLGSKVGFYKLSESNKG